MALVAVIAGMGGVVYYAVPLYRVFCQVTGFGGTTQTAAAAPGATGERIITVRFNADISRRLDWEFRPAQRQVALRVGEEALAFFVARNRSPDAAIGTATFNVTPQKAGAYFAKIDCFCFERQRLAPGERADLPVTFFIDPGILDDRNLDDVDTITLSYTFFRVSDERAEASGAPAAAED